MCGIFGFTEFSLSSHLDFMRLAELSKRRGADSSGLAVLSKLSKNYKVLRGDSTINQLIKCQELGDASFIIGHSRLITNSMKENQPIVKDGMILIHNGIVVNEDDIWAEFEQKREQKIDSEAILAPFLAGIQNKKPLSQICDSVLRKVQGTLSCAICLTKLGKLVLISNTGSLYYGQKLQSNVFASEKSFLKEVGVTNVRNIKNSYVILDIPEAGEISQQDLPHVSDRNLIPCFKYNKNEEHLLENKNPKLKRCSKCILPDTMPHIEFDNDGICNYCKNYKIRNKPKPIENLQNLLDKYRRNGEHDCILPFSGGRDSCFALHLAKKKN
jgi:glutamine phosphoribosylpyrophosphate amidotransferase